MRLFMQLSFVVGVFLLNLTFDLNAKEISWAQKTLDSMTIDEKVGQLFMVAGYIDPEFAQNEIGNPQIIQEIDRYITDYYLGGIAYVGPSESTKQVALTNHYQQISKYPILIAQDLEWGLSMRLKDGMNFPKNITLGEICDNALIYNMGLEIGIQAKLIGVHMNLSPVLDVNIEPENIVINVRSFGSSPQKVAENGIAMIRGLQEAGIIASAKHFPGLGDIKVDPHLGLPSNQQKMERLQEVELFPFKRAIEAGVLSIQTEHLIIPTLEPDATIPPSLSQKIVNELLKKELGFQGLVLSGALRMKALTQHFSDEEIIIKAFLAGNDMLLMPQDFPKAYHILKTALYEGKISIDDVDEHVLKILQMKEKVKLNFQRLIEVPTRAQLNPLSAIDLKRKLFQSAVSFVRFNPQLISYLVNFGKKTKILYVQIGDAISTDFCDEIKPFINNDSYIFPDGLANIEQGGEFLKRLEHYSLVILAVYPADPRRIAEIRLLNETHQKEALKEFRVHGISEKMLSLINKLKCYQEKTVVIFFGNQFGLHFFDEFSTLLMAHEQDSDAQRAAADMLIKKILTN